MLLEIVKIFRAIPETIRLMKIEFLRRLERHRKEYQYSQSALSLKVSSDTMFRLDG